MVAPAASPSLADFVGFRRRFRVCPQPNCVIASVEDDIHCMQVRIEHDGTHAIEVTAEQKRAPWTTCPGAIKKLIDTFDGVELAAFARRREKHQNCTHLYDLALLAAAHAHDTQVLEYDIYVTDPSNGVRKAEIWKDGEQLLAWSVKGTEVVEPEEIAGKGLFELSEWIGSLNPEEREVAKILRWANLVANGRIIPFEEQADATKMPPNCYTFQPQRAKEALRVGETRDFSHGLAEPLDGS